MSDLGFNVWGALASAAGILFALYPAFKAWVRPRLPTSLLPEILAMYKETQELFATALQDGLIDDPAALYLCNLNMAAHASAETQIASANRTSIRVNELRAQVYAIKSWRQDVGKWWSGLSGTIRLFGKELSAFRSNLAEQNSQKLKLLASQGLLLGERSLLSQDSKCHAADSDSKNVPIASPPPPQGPHHLSMAIRCGNCSDYRPQPNEPDSTPSAGLKASDESSGHSSFRRQISLTYSNSLCVDLTVVHTDPSPVGQGKIGKIFPSTRASRTEDEQRAGLERLVRRLYGLRARSRMADMSGKGEVVLDPESLTPLGVTDDDTDGESDEWEEECQ
ncbi:hypothetical protein ACG7TL_002092 [Trametes sanguinea]